MLPIHLSEEQVEVCSRLGEALHLQRKLTAGTQRQCDRCRPDTPTRAARIILYM
jgi:hypothetical protein